MLLHHPFQSFAPVMDFVRQAAADPHVLAIKQTLYRTGARLAGRGCAGRRRARRQGSHGRSSSCARASTRKPTSSSSNRLQEAGAHVVYGVVGYKTHAKMMLVVRREPGGIRRYCHLGTGNYHPRTARAYTDYGLFTCDDEIGHDVHEVFLQLTSLTQTPKLKLPAAVAVQPARGDARARSTREAEHARAGQPGAHHREDERAGGPAGHRGALPRLARRRAGSTSSCAACARCARESRGVSENIRVRSIVGRFLEHSRVFYFENGGEPELYCASADWMERNFFRRVEVAFPIRRDAHRAAHPARPGDSTWRRHARPGMLRTRTARTARQPQRRAIAASSCAGSNCSRDVRDARASHAAQLLPAVRAQPARAESRAAAKPDARLQVIDLLLQVRGGQRMVLQPARREAHFERCGRARPARSPAARWRCGRGAAAPPGAAARSGTPRCDPRAAPAPRARSSVSLRRWAPTSRASRRCSSRGNPGMSAFSSR